jgi:hypothetical protein
MKAVSLPESGISIVVDNFNRKQSRDRINTLSLDSIPIAHQETDTERFKISMMVLLFSQRRKMWIVWKAKKATIY